MVSMICVMSRIEIQVEWLGYIHYMQLVAKSPIIVTVLLVCRV